MENNEMRGMVVLGRDSLTLAIHYTSSVTLYAHVVMCLIAVHITIASIPFLMS